MAFEYFIWYEQAVYLFFTYSFKKHRFNAPNYKKKAKDWCLKFILLFFVSKLFGIYQVVKKKQTKKNNKENVTQETCSISVKTQDIFLKIGDNRAE